MEAVLFIGVQASGKSTFYRERFFSSHVRINLDMLKTRHREKRLLEVCLDTIHGLSVATKNELLFQNGINFNALPLWQKRGFGVYWEEYDHSGANPITGEKVIVRRKRLHRDLELPMKDEYSTFLRNLVTKES